MSETITIPSNLQDQVDRTAEQLGVTPRRLLAAMLSRQADREFKNGDRNGLVQERSNDPLFEDVPVYQGDAPADGSVRHDEYLYGDDV